MLQNNHHFLFPQIYFGSLEDFDELYDLHGDEIDADPALILSFHGNLLNTSYQKIGLYIDWSCEF